MLSFRFDKIATLLSNNQNIIANIKRNKKTLKWHLSRLYRTRNVIAHEANSIDITLVLPHLHQYAILTLETVLRFINGRSTTDINELFVLLSHYENIIHEELKDDVSNQKELKQLINIIELIS
ncbi:hypothetical protein D3C76_1425070 [compost metagenome]